MLTSTFENALNRGLPRSPRARQLCAELAGRRLAVEIRGFTRFVLESTGDSLRLTRDATALADAEIRGGPFSLLSLANTPSGGSRAGTDIEILGDAELAQKFHELALLLRPDVEEELSLVVGDASAHRMGNLVRQAFGWTRKAAGTTAQNVAEYLSHERRDLVPRQEGEQFLKGVDALREDVDRLESRVALLTARLDQKGPS